MEARSRAFPFTNLSRKDTITTKVKPDHASLPSACGSRRKRRVSSAACDCVCGWRHQEGEMPAEIDYSHATGAFHVKH